MLTELVADARDNLARCRDEASVQAEEETRVHNLKMDYMPALHYIVTKLAHKGLLEDMIRNLQEG